MRALIAAALLLLPVPAQAEGFAVHDLTTVATDLQKALGDGFVERAEPTRVTLTCPSCAGAPIIDVLIGRQTDGTEQRIRSGETKIARMEALCREREPACRLVALDVAPAIGWITAYPMGDHAGATAVVLRDSDLLTIRSIAGNAATARAHADKLLAVARGIIGD
ncbi:hypothetical protein [Sphingomonas immobilis]|uniref:Uncharacterized protein n=1 Tax=Sphingomonas immobilis TaxID=3063997 RepID=A0ABT9A338_9SPHN|nr:hypothetical protein [Sphingomonas sp. CA1-15]MDO7843963.1 hypothetical protein [Sphingomonas sp. CA1-15]